MEDTPTIQFPRTVRVNERRVCFRPVTPDDRDRIVQGLRSMSVETSYRRFFTPTFYPSEKTLRYLTHIDGDQHMAIGAVDCSREGHPGIGAARYVRLPERPSIAEAAVVVIDAYQRQGIGSMLIAALSRYAADHDIEGFRGFVLAENRDFLSYLRALGATNEHAHDGVIQIDLPVYTRAKDFPSDSSPERARGAWKKIDDARLEDCEGTPTEA